MVMHSIINIIFDVCSFHYVWTYVMVLWCYTYAVICGYCTRTRTCTWSYYTRNIPGKLHLNLASVDKELAILKLLVELHVMCSSLIQRQQLIFLWAWQWKTIALLIRCSVEV